MRLATALAACLTTTALTLGLGALPAQAESRTVTDAAGDVRTFDISEDDNWDEIPVDEASDTPDGDIISATYLHTKRRMSLSVSYADLPRTGALRSWIFRLQGRNGQQRELEVSTGLGAGLPVEMYRVSNGRRVCRGDIKRHIFYGAKRIEVSFPRHCLGAPLAFRVAHVGVRLELNAPGENARFYYDDPQRTGGSVEQILAKFSPWVSRN